MPENDAVKAQLEALRHKLLDLTLRNRMLNHRPSKRLGISMTGESSLQVFQMLVEQGKKFTFLGKPDPIRQPTLSDRLSDHSDAVAMGEHRQAAEEEIDGYLGNAALSADQTDTKLQVNETESTLQAKLRTIRREALLATEELGINTLFLTLGMLSWSETPDRVNKAPLLFIPVRLEEKGGHLALVYEGGDVGDNLSLRAKLREVNLKLPEYRDEIDVLEYFSEVESTVRSRDDWAVSFDDINIGFFSYEKYAMYADLGGDQWPENKKPWMGKDLIAMLGGMYEAADSPIGDQTPLDSVRGVQESHEVYDADSSQVLAMIRAANGLSIVVEGPPGTGKSQTITNIIAEAVAANKTVLFVSAKRAALEVVKQKLSSANLGEMCLDLHDKLTNRREFYAEIKRTAEKSGALKSEVEKIARLTELRDTLNQYADALNEPLLPYNLTPFEVIGRLGSLPVETAEDRNGRIPFSDLKSLTGSELLQLIPSVLAMQAKLPDLGVPQEHPFWGTELTAIDPALKLDIQEDLSLSLYAISKAIESVGLASTALRIDVPTRIGDIAILNACLDRALSAPALDGIALKTGSWVSEEGSIRMTLRDLRRRSEIRQARKAAVMAAAWDQDFSLLQPVYLQWSGSWYGFVSGDFRSARKTLKPFLMQPLSPPEELALVSDLCEAKSLENKVRSATNMSRLFGVQWRGLESDPATLERLLDWVIDLHQKIGSQDLPGGLLDLFSGQISEPELKALVASADAETLSALSATRKLTEILKMPSPDLGQSLDQLIGTVASWQDSVHRLAEMISFNESRRSVLEKGMASIVEVACIWKPAAERLTDVVLRSYYTGVVREAMETRAPLRTFDRHAHEALIAEFQSLDDFKLQYNRAQVRIAHYRNMPSLSSAAQNSNLHTLKVQCELKTRHKPIRWIMERAGEAIQCIKPVFMMSPLSVAIHLPPGLPAFDIVVFDEASQVRPEDAMCAVIRGNQTIVVGDTRQMPPSSFFDRLGEDDVIDEEEDEVAENARETAKLESILSLMSAVTTGKTRRPDLRWHYRSVHPSLIQPSNEMFYDNRLIIFPSPDTMHQGSRIGVVFHHDPTTVYESGSKKRINEKEADQVAAAVVTHLRENANQSLMVAAMNKSQADLIYDRVQLLERKNPDLFQAYRVNHPNESLTIKNLENVQGDERDVVFISVTYGRDISGVIRQTFGPLIKDGGERRLNVLITRARMRCEVFSNMTGDDIRIAQPSPGLVAFKKYLQFAERGEMEISMVTGGGEESPFEEEVSAALLAHGYLVDTQVGCAEFRIDLAVRDRDQAGKYVLGIECDGATYHSARSARDRDKLRQRILESRGWRIHRIWSHDWWQDKDAEIKRLVDAIESSMGEEPVAHPMAVSETEDFVEDTSASHSEAEPYVATTQPGPISGQDELARYLQVVVSIEGPIEHGLLVIRLRDASGFGRAGSNLQQIYSALIQTALRERRIFQQGNAYFTEQSQLSRVRDWSLRPTGERRPTYVSDAEIEAAIKLVVAESFGIDAEGAVKATFRKLGFKRITADSVQRGIDLIPAMVASGSLTMDGNLLR